VLCDRDSVCTACTKVDGNPFAYNTHFDKARVLSISTCDIEDVCGGEVVSTIGVRGKRVLDCEHVPIPGTCDADKVIICGSSMMNSTSRPIALPNGKRLNGWQCSHLFASSVVKSSLVSTTNEPILPSPGVTAVSRSHAPPSGSTENLTVDPMDAPSPVPIVTGWVL